MSTTLPRLAAPPETLDDDPPVAQIMEDAAPRLLPSGTRLSTALQRMEDQGVQHLLVVGDGRPRVVSQTSVLRWLVESGASPAWVLDPVEDHAVPALQVSPGLRCSYAAAVMRGAGVGLVVIVDDGRPVGVVTERTLVGHLALRRRGRPVA